MMDAALNRLRSHLIRGEVPRARASERRISLEARRDEARFREVMEVPGSDPDAVIMARSRGPDGMGYWAGLALSDLLSMHGWLVGATGSGKTYLALGLLLQVLQSSQCPVVVFDMKGEFSELIGETVLPALARTPAGLELLRNLRIVNPFHPAYIPELRITLPEPGVPREAQALAIASNLEEAIGETPTLRMARVLSKLVALAIELNLPLTVLQEWLGTPAAFVRSARGSSDPRIRQYAAGAFTEEARSSIAGLAVINDNYSSRTATTRFPVRFHPPDAPSCSEIPASRG